MSKAANVKQRIGIHHNPLDGEAALLSHEENLATLMPGAFLAREGVSLTLHPHQP